jgi:hypothetical protein
MKWNIASESPIFVVEKVLSLYFVIYTYSSYKEIIEFLMNSVQSMRRSLRMLIRSNFSFMYEVI